MQDARFLVLLVGSGVLIAISGILMFSRRALGAGWMLAVAKLPRLRHLMAQQAYASTLGSPEHGETPELYQDVMRRFLPRAAVVVGSAFVIVLVRALP